MTISVAVTETNIKYPGIGVSIFGREGRSQKVRISQYVRIEGTYGSSCSSESREVIRIGNGYAFDTPEDTCRRVPPDHDVIS